MTDDHFSDEVLMAFADGELDEATAEAVQTAMESDDRLVDRVAEFMESRGNAKAALAPMLREPMPDALMASVQKMVADSVANDGSGTAGETTNVVAMAPHRRKGQSSFRQNWAVPIAASVAAVVAGLAGFTAGTFTDDRSQPAMQVAGIASPMLFEALNSVESGQESILGDTGDRFTAIASFRDSAGALCREFEVDSQQRSSVVAVACHPTTEWEVRFAVVAPTSENSYAPASSMEALNAYLSAIEAGEPLIPADEAEALKSLR